jgi:hypothetical protein
MVTIEYPQASHVKTAAAQWVAPFSSSLFSRSKAAQALVDGVRPAMTKQALVSDRKGSLLSREALPRRRLWRARAWEGRYFWFSPIERGAARDPVSRMPKERGRGSRRTSATRRRDA